MSKAGVPSVKTELPTKNSPLASGSALQSGSPSVDGPHSKAAEERLERCKRFFVLDVRNRDEFEGASESPSSWEASSAAAWRPFLPIR